MRVTLVGDVPRVLVALRMELDRRSGRARVVFEDPKLWLDELALDGDDAYLLSSGARHRISRARGTVDSVVETAGNYFSNPIVGEEMLWHYGQASLSYYDLELLFGAPLRSRVSAETTMAFEQYWTDRPDHRNPAASAFGSVLAFGGGRLYAAREESLWCEVERDML